VLFPAGGGAATDHQKTISASSINLRSREGSTDADALRNTLDLARLADELGYARYWVAEHHNTPMLACASREVMIASIGSTTRRIRIGSGGVMLPHHSPFKVAETFSIPSALFPDRVDLGIGRAPGTDPSTAFALAKQGQAADEIRTPGQSAPAAESSSESLASQCGVSIVGPKSLPGMIRLRRKRRKEML
jgi:luciferase-like monooxygenase